MATGGIVHRGLRYELMPVSMLISAAVPFCLLLKGVELLILRPTRHTSAHVNFCRGSVLSTAERSRVTYFTTDKAHERAAVSQGGVGKRWKNHGVFLRYSFFFGLDPAPPSFRHARPRVRRPSGLDSSVLGPVSNSVVSDLFRKSARQEKRRNVPPRSM